MITGRFEKECSGILKFVRMWGTRDNSLHFNKHENKIVDLFCTRLSKDISRTRAALRQYS
jgi:hypothetical protein